MTKEEIIEELNQRLGFDTDYEMYSLCKYEREFYNAIIKALEQQPSDDCVSREAVLDLMQLKMGGKELYKAVYDLPPVTPTQRWIPVSERLPEDRNIVLVTAYWHETYQVMMASYFGEGLWWCVPFNNCGDHMQKLNPKAWQPLPKPYEEKRGSENGSN